MASPRTTPPTTYEVQFVDHTDGQSYTERLCYTEKRAEQMARQVAMEKPEGTNVFVYNCDLKRKTYHALALNGKVRGSHY